MSKIYVPDLSTYKCHVVQSENVIRGYKEVPRNNATIEYRDYYVTGNYLYRDGSQSFGQYTTLPVCLAISDLTSEVYYRNDFANILIIFLILCIFCFYIPLKIFVRLFRRLQ